MGLAFRPSGLFGGATLELAEGLADDAVGGVPLFGFVQPDRARNGTKVREVNREVTGRRERDRRMATHLASMGFADDDPGVRCHGSVA